MIALDKDALICDMAETYRIFDLRSVPLSLLATLASGLGMNSRIRLKEYGIRSSWESVLLAKLWDFITGSEEARITPYLIYEEKNKEPEFRTFATIEEFEQARAEILAGCLIEVEAVYGGD